MLIYNELITTTKEYMRNVIQIEPKWLIEVPKVDRFVPQTQLVNFRIVVT